MAASMMKALGSLHKMLQKSAETKKELERGEAKRKAEAAAANRTASADVESPGSPTRSAHTSGGLESPGKRRRVEPLAAAAAAAADPESTTATDAGDERMAMHPANHEVVRDLTRLFEYHSTSREAQAGFKRKNLGTVVMYLSLLPRPTGEYTDAELKKIPHLGDKTLKKIRDIETYGELRKLKEIMGPREKAVIELRRVHGIGKDVALNLFDQCKIRSIDELRAAVERRDRTALHLLPPAALVGLKYFEDINKRIPRAMVERIGGKVIEVAKRLSPGCEAHLCGSYRRGAATCGDIDVLIAADSAAEINLEEIVRELKRLGVVSEDLTLSNKMNKSADEWVDQTGSKWLGLAVDEGDSTRRRLDIMTCPRSELPFQLIYLTGSEFLQRAMRTRAHKLGLSMSQHGFRIKKLDPDSKLERVEGGTTLPASQFRTERDVFDKLGLEYLEPCDRNLGNKKLSAWPSKYSLTPEDLSGSS